jgi:hypothetical protein
MPFPIKVCAVCSEEFELKPDKPGFANRCPECSAADADDTAAKNRTPAGGIEGGKEVDAERRKVMREMLYRKDS